MAFLTAPFVMWYNSVWEVCDYKYHLVTVLFMKTKKMSLKKSTFLLHPIFVIFCRKLIVAFKNRSRRAQVDQNKMKFVFCMKIWLLGFIVPLTDI